MTFAAIISLIQGLFQFPGEISALIKMLKATPEEQRENLMKSVSDEASKFQVTGRPQW